MSGEKTTIQVSLAILVHETGCVDVSYCSKSDDIIDRVKIWRIFKFDADLKI